MENRFKRTDTANRPDPIFEDRQEAGRALPRRLVHLHPRDDYIKKRSDPSMAQAIQEGLGGIRSARQEVLADLRDARRENVESRPHFVLTNTQGDKVAIAGPRLFSLFKEAVDALYKEQPEI